jgi:hypothetical protein
VPSSGQAFLAVSNSSTYYGFEIEVFLYATPGDCSDLVMIESQSAPGRGVTSARLALRAGCTG